MGQQTQEGEPMRGPVEGCEGCAALDAEALARGEIVIQPGDDPDEFCPDPTCDVCESEAAGQRQMERREARELAASLARTEYSQMWREADRSGPRPPSDGRAAWRFTSDRCHISPERSVLIQEKEAG